MTLPVDTESTTPVLGDLNHEFRAMASQVRVQLVEPTPGASAALGLAQDVFTRVEAACTRFDPQSPLMRANAASTSWHRVPLECFDALTAARDAHRETDGLFDPRVLERLTSYGYDRTLPFESEQVQVTTPAARTPRRSRRSWRPGLDADQLRVRIGRRAVDLGGIGKGLAVRWSGRPLRRAGRAALVQAGGDCLALGRGPDRDGWRIAVEDPFGGESPVAVLALSDLGVATSSTRVRQWSVDGRPVHHLIDPRTGESADSGLVAVTVVDPDPARAEVWSKALFVSGRDGIAALCTERGLPALWVDTDGRVRTSRAMAPLVTWQVQHVR